LKEPVVSPWVLLAVVVSVTALWGLAIFAGRAERRLDQCLLELVRIRIEMEHQAGGGTGPVLDKDELVAAALEEPPPPPRRAVKAKPVDLDDLHEWRLEAEEKIPRDQ